MAAEEARNLGLYGMRQQRSRAVAKNLGQWVRKRPWLRQLDDIILVTAYHSFSGEVEASNTPTIRRLTPSRRHQLPRIALVGPLITKLGDEHFGTLSKIAKNQSSTNCNNNGDHAD